MPIGEEQFVLVTTFRKSGDAVPTPTWIVTLDDGRVGFWTSSSTGKVKRVRRSPRVTVQPCDRRGKPAEGAPVIEGTAEILTDGPVFDEIHTKVVAKYGFMTKVTTLLGKLGHLGDKTYKYGDIGFAITLAQQ